MQVLAGDYLGVASPRTRLDGDGQLAQVQEDVWRINLNLEGPARVGVCVVVKAELELQVRLVRE